MNLLGMTVEEINEENSRKFGIDLKSGLLIVGVDPVSRSGNTGISQGIDNDGALNIKKGNVVSRIFVGDVVTK